MQEYQERVVTEKIELEIKINSLKNFLQNNHNKNIVSPEELDRMTRQLEVMEIYANVLSERIDSF